MGVMIIVPLDRELWEALLEMMHAEYLDKINGEMTLKNMAEMEMSL